MTAAHGVVHEEMHSPAFVQRGGELELVQLWVNLPARAKLLAPDYQELRAASLPRAARAAGAGEVRAIAGSCFGVRGPARTTTPIVLADLTLRAGAAVPLELPAAWTRFVLVRRGSLQLDGVHASAGDLLELTRGSDDCGLQVGAAPAQCLLLAGEVIDEPVVGHGPFVMNHWHEIETAMREFRAGRLGALA
jgi:hypothetical protein